VFASVCMLTRSFGRVEGLKDAVVSGRLDTWWYPNGLGALDTRKFCWVRDLSSESLSDLRVVFNAY
jgi:hypothetical protein